MPARKLWVRVEIAEGKIETVPSMGLNDLEIVGLLEAAIHQRLSSTIGSRAPAIGVPEADPPRDAPSLPPITRKMIEVGVRRADQ